MSYPQVLMSNDDLITVLKVTKFGESHLNRFCDIQQNPRGGGGIFIPPGKIGLTLVYQGNGPTPKKSFLHNLG